MNREGRGRDVKLIAFHLPQFHRTPENDAWWGEGFTEWTNVKKAVPLYRGHNQPREPLEGNYYQLDDIDTLIWQMELAKRYGVYGFCYYHYWFNGKLLLNKPLELMRDYSGDKLPYFFCWANEPWTRVWEGDAQKVLMPQNYGREDEWEEHLQYMLTFFQDPVYIKIDNMPIFVVYRTNNIPDCEEMIAYWNMRSVDYGYKGIYIIEEVNSFQSEPICPSSRAFLEFEPLFTMTLGRTPADKMAYKLHSDLFNAVTKNHNQCYSYDRLWKRMIGRKHMEVPGKECYAGAFVDWDNTARKGNRGRIVMGTTPEKFKKYLFKQKKKAMERGDDFIFINAWNEWGEGTYLEPDSKFGYAFLEAVSQIFAEFPVSGGIGGGGASLLIGRPCNACFQIGGAA